MKRLNDFIFESTTVSTKSNKERKKELEKWLKHKKYKDYVETLNKMLEDPKAKTLLEDGFGGDLGDTNLVFSIQEIPSQNLVPTQSEIDLDKSIKYPLSKKESLEKTFEEPIKIEKPIVTFRNNYIIDGHHSWLQAVLLNPEGKVLCFNYDADISPIQMLKAVQGTIAAVKASQNEKKIPSQTVKGPNIFDKEFTEKEIKKYLKEHIEGDMINDLLKYTEQDEFDELVDFLCDRMLDIKVNNPPLENAPKRKDMPQVFKAGTNKGDKSSAYPDKEGSALNKLKDDKFNKSVTK